MSEPADVDLMELLHAINFMGDPLTLPIPSCFVDCDCPLDPHHRWNCALTPIWAQTMRDLDCNPWTVVSFVMSPISGLTMLDGWIDPDPWPELRNVRDYEAGAS